MTSWWPFPPETRRVQLDEKWSFVGKEQKHRDPTDPDDDHRGDHRDHIAYDPERKLVLAVVPGARTEEDARTLMAEVKGRLGGGPARLITGDEYPAYATAIAEVFSEPVPEPARRGPGRPRVAPERRPPEAVVYATVREEREDGRVVSVETRRVFGIPAAPEDASTESSSSRRVNTSFLGRRNGVDRGRDARKARRTYRFSKDWQVHEAMTYLTMYGYNSCWRVRTPRVKGDDDRWRERSPAMSSGLTNHVWTWREWFKRPAVQSTWDTTSGWWCPSLIAG